MQAALADGIPLKPDAAALVRAVSVWGLKLAVATSAKRDHADLHLNRSGLLPHLPVLVTRDKVTRGKLFPDLFLLAAERLGVKPANCVAVEVSLNGIPQAST